MSEGVTCIQVRNNPERMQAPTIDMKSKTRKKRMKRIMQAMQETEQEVREENEYIV